VAQTEGSGAWRALVENVFERAGPAPKPGAIDASYAGISRPLPSVSLIVRCFNEEAHIGRLLKGALSQTQPPDEVVVVDSGSTDDTLSIAERFDVKIVHVSPELFSLDTH